MATFTFTIEDPVLAAIASAAGKVTIDHVTEALDRLPQQHKDQTNTEALLSALARPSQDLETALCELFLERTIDTAEGVQLDDLGAIVGTARIGLSDEDYRTRIRARIAVNKSNGLVNELLNIVRLIMNSTDGTVEWIPDNPAAGRLVLNGLIPSVTQANTSVNFAQTAASAGVRIILEFTGVADVDTFTLAVFAALNGAEGVGGPKTINVDDASRFPQSGSFIIDEGLAAEETVSYTGKTATTLLGVTFANSHLTGAGLTVDGLDGKGLGDSTDPNVGGQFAYAIESPSALTELVTAPSLFPESIPVWRISYPTTDPLLIWPCQDVVGGVGDDEILEVVSGVSHFELIDQEPTQQSSGEGGRVGVLFDATNESVFAPDSAFDIPIGSGGTLWMRVFIPTLSVGTATLLEFDSTANGNIQCTTGGLLSFNNIEDADSNQASGTIATQDHQNAWHSIVLVIDANTGAEFEVTMYTGLGSIGPVAASGGGSAENAVNLTDIQIMTVPREGFTIGYMAWFDAALTAEEAGVLTGISP